MRSVIIIGGGLGGLTLAHYLAQKHPEMKVTIYERDIDAIGRQQGFYIGINTDGTRVLENIAPKVEGLAKMLDIDSNPDTPKAMNLVSDKLRILLTFRVRRSICLVSRWGLRKTLAQNLNIVWNKQFSHYEEDDKKVIAHFTDGTTAEGDFLVAADGAKSQVRKQRCAAANGGKGFLLHDVGITNIAGLAPGTLLKDMPDLNNVLEFTRSYSNVGMTLLMFRYHGDQPNAPLEILWALSWPTEEIDRKEKQEIWSKKNMSKEETQRELEKLRARMLVKVKKAFAHPDIAKIVENTPTEQLLGIRNLICADPKTSENPFSCAPGKRSRVTLLGDAAHPMTTHRGVGANTAFLDAEKLADAIGTSNHENWQEKLNEYEEDLYKRGFLAARQSLQATLALHSSGWKATTRDWLMWTVGWVLIPYNAFWKWRGQ